MKFTTASAALSLLSLASALPTDGNTEATILRPTTISQYNVWTGAVTYNTAQGKIFKNGRESDITTLGTFDVPASAAGRQCEFFFSLGPNTVPRGVAQFDVYTSLAPADHPTTTWPNGSLRNQYLGRLRAVQNGLAVDVEGFPAVTGQLFPCPAGETLGGELVGAGDYVDVTFDAATEGPYIKIHN